MAYITNNGFLGLLSFTRMRKELLKVFDKIYVVDLKGDLRRERVPWDENVFGIMTGVCIFFGIKYKKQENQNKKDCKGRVFYTSITGRREEKLAFLKSANFYELIENPKHEHHFKEIFEPLLVSLATILVIY